MNPGAELFTVKKTGTSSNAIQITVGATPPKNLGEYCALLKTSLVVDGKPRVITVLLVVNVAASYEINPPAVRLSQLEENGTYSIRILIKRRDGVVFDIKSMDCPADVVQATYKRYNERSYFVYLEVDVKKLKAAGEVKLPIKVIRGGVQETIDYRIFYERDE